VDLAADPAHCGGCGRACEAGVECLAGGCGTVREEVEPNDEEAQCNRVVTGDWRVEGVIDPRGDRDWYCVFARAGQRVFFDVNTARRSRLDSVLRLHALEPDVVLLAENDDEARWETDSLLRHVFEVAGEYAIEVGAADDGGGEDHTYELRLR